MPVSPTLFIGLGEFGATLSTFNHESFNTDYASLSKLHASLNFNGEITFTTAKNPSKEIGFIDVLKQNSFKENFERLNKDISRLKSAIQDGIEYVINSFNAKEITSADLEVSKKKKVIIYFSLGDTVSSVSIQKTIELITNSRNSNFLELYLVCINYDLLDEDEKRAYACLSELDHYLSTNSSVYSFTILSKYGLDGFGGHQKEDIVQQTYVLSKKIIYNQVDAITSQAIRSHLTENNRKVIYNSFGSASLVYDKDKVWQKFCDHEKISFLSDLIHNIENREFARGIITAPVNTFVLNNSSDSLKKQLSTDEQDISLFRDVKEIILGKIAQVKPETSSEFVSLLVEENDKYNAENWFPTTSDIGNNISIVESSFKEKIENDILSIINDDNGLVKLRATLNILLNQEDKSIDGVVIDHDLSFLTLIDNQLIYFKELYQSIPVDERIEEVKEIIFDEDIKRLKKDIINIETKISGIKEDIVQLDRSFLLKNQETTVSTIQDGYFTIAGEKVNINGCIDQDSNYEDLYTQQIDSIDFREMVDLRGYLSEDIENQGMIGSCVTNAISTALEYISKRSTGSFFPMSRMFLYYTSRDFANEDDEIKDVGCNIFQALLSAQEHGVCLELSWPYDIENVNEKPNSYAYVEAERYKVEQFLKIKPNMDDMLSCLSEGYPFVFGLKITDSFNKLDGFISVPSSDEVRSDIHGNHAMLCVGFNREKKVFIVRNSWGKDWGDKGYCYIPFDYMTNSELIHNIFTIRSVDEEVNEIIKTNIWGKELGYFADGVNNHQQVERLSKVLEEEQEKYQEKIKKHQKMDEMLDNQNRLFKDIGFRNSIESKLQEIKNEDINDLEEELAANETNLTNVQKNFSELKSKEKLFIYKWIGIPIAIISLLLIIAYFTGYFGVLVQSIGKDLINIFKFDFQLIHPFNSGIIILLFSGTVYCAYKYFKNYYLIFKKYNRERGKLENKDRNDKLDIVSLYHNKWKLKFDYHINTHLLEEVLNGVNSFIHDKLKGLKEFIESLKQFRERVSGSYTELIVKETVFSQNIFKIPDRNNIEEYYKEGNQGNNLNLVNQGFTNENTMLYYFNEYLNRNNVFEREVETLWDDRKDSYLHKYTLSDLFDNNYFNINEKVNGWNNFLKRYSTQLLEVSDSYLEMKPEKSFDVYYSDNGFKVFSDQLIRNMSGVNVSKHENNNEITIFRFVNTFPAYYISCFEHLYGSDVLSEYFIYENIPPLEPNNN